jgi:hypoxanthine phosphoribosyltransferase
MSDTPGIQQRIFTHARVLRITLDAYDQAVRLLGDAVSSLGPIHAVIGIANGGVAPARGISVLLGVINYQITARHNPTNAIYTQATGQVTVDLPALATTLQGQQLSGRVLLVDDICGTGATFTAALTALQPHLHSDAEVTTVSLCRNAGASLDPDLWVWTVDDWVLFPWEPRPPSTAAIEDLPAPQRVNTP